MRFTATFPICLASLLTLTASTALAAPDATAADKPAESAEADAEPSAPAPEPRAAEPAPVIEAPAAATSPSVVAPEPSVATDAAVAKSEDTEDEPSPWVPPQEAELMSKHAVNFDKMKFKPGTGLEISSEDGKFKMAPRLRVQFRYTFENDHEASELSQSFQIRRARLQFKGNVFGKHNKYKVEFAFSPRDLGMRNGNPTRTPILTWFTEFDYLRDFTVKVGQYKIPFSRQRVISSGDLEMVDRALGNGEFNQDRDTGIEFMSKDLGGLGYLRYHAGVFMGEGRDLYQSTDFRMHYLARVEVLPFGGADSNWDYKEADFDRLKTPRLSLGAAYSYIDHAQRDRGVLGSTPTDGGTTNYHSVTGDFMFKVAGVSLSGEFYWREGKRNFGDATVEDALGNDVPAPQVPTRDGIGYYLQAGYLIPKLPLGVAARWSQVLGLGAGNETSLNDGEEVGLGLSYYLAQHPLKIQADYFRKRRDEYDVDSLSFARQAWKDSADEIRVQMQFAF